MKWTSSLKTGGEQKEQEGMVLVLLTVWAWSSASIKGAMPCKRVGLLWLRLMSIFCDVKDRVLAGTGELVVEWTFNHGLIAAMQKEQWRRNSSYSCSEYLAEWEFALRLDERIACRLISHRRSNAFASWDRIPAHFGAGLDYQIWNVHDVWPMMLLSSVRSTWKWLALSSVLLVSWLNWYARMTNQDVTIYIRNEIFLPMHYIYQHF